jgi:hypothetical protein
MAGSRGAAQHAYDGDELRRTSEGRGFHKFPLLFPSINAHLQRMLVLYVGLVLFFLVVRTSLSLAFNPAGRGSGGALGRDA